MSYRIRDFCFEHCWWITITVFGLLVFGVWNSRIEDKDKVVFIVTSAGVALGVYYFVQKQKLEEVLLFEKLFTKFNERYAILDKELRTFVANDSPFEPENGNALNAYFNLCAEEYLFYSQGWIRPEVWRAWCRGMKDHLKNSRVREFFDKEMLLDSHYGFNLKAIDN